MYDEKTKIVNLLSRVHTGHRKPGKSWNFYTECPAGQAVSRFGSGIFFFSSS